MKKSVVLLKNGEKILLRQVKSSDIDGIWNNFNEVVEEGIYLPVLTPVKSQIEKDSWYDTIKNENEVCIIAEHPQMKLPNSILGQCEISNTQWEAGTHVGILGIIINSKYRNLGLGRHLIHKAIRNSKKLNGMEKIVLSCFSTNENAIHLYENMGFEQVGLRKKQYRIDSKYYDEVLMELWIDDYLTNFSKRFTN